MAPTLSSLRVYPVKGCKGIELQSGVVTATGACDVDPQCSRRRRRPNTTLPTPARASPLRLHHRSRRPRPAPAAAGLLFDRNWVIVKESGGRFLTQRQQPKLCLVEQAIVPEPLLQGADLAACPDAKLVLRAPGMPELQVGGCCGCSMPLPARTLSTAVRRAPAVPSICGAGPAGHACRQQEAD